VHPPGRAPSHFVRSGRLLRTGKLSEISAAAEWDSTSGPKVFQMASDFIPGMEKADIVQASGGHNNPVFYVGDPGASTTFG
jgi:hypothetical protein